VRDTWTCKVLEGTHEGTIRRVAFSPNGKLLAAASFDATCSIWEETNGDWKMVATLEGHENEVKCVAFDSSGSYIATCSRDKSVWIWVIESYDLVECVEVCSGHTQDVKAVLWHPNREMLVSCSYDDTLKVWTNSADDWYCSDTLTGHTSTVWDIAFDPLGNTLVSVSDDLSMIFWNKKDQMPIVDQSDTENASGWSRGQVIRCHKRTIYSVDWSNNNVIATGCSDNCIRIFTQDPITNEFGIRLTRQKAHSTDINCVAWNPKYPNVLASAGDDCVIRIWSFQLIK